MRADGDWGKVADGLNAPSALAMSPDRKLLFACDRQSHWIYGYLVGPDGSLRYGQRFYWLHVSESNDGTPDSSGASAMAVDRDGNLYVATRMGVQVADRNGRVRAILTLPEGGVTSLCFGGADFDTLYIVCDGRLYKRKMKLPGVPAVGGTFRAVPRRRGLSSCCDLGTSHGSGDCPQQAYSNFRTSFNCPSYSRWSSRVRFRSVASFTESPIQDVIVRTSW